MRKITDTKNSAGIAGAPRISGISAFIHIWMTVMRFERRASLGEDA